MWIVDSSKFIDWIRDGRNPTRILRPFVLADRLRSCGIVRVEVLRGAVKPKVKAELTALFEAIPDISMGPAIWKRIADLAWRLDRRGIVLPVSDLVIGGCALHAKATLVTTDAHFSSIPELRVSEDLPDWR